MTRKYLMTTRFSNATFAENQEYLKNNANGKMKCIYCSPQKISKHVPEDALILVLEMNNDANRIVGIGIVRNHPVFGKYPVYSNGNYNRFAFKGQYRIDRTELTEYEEKVFQALDILCFTGSRHSKRGQGLRMFPLDFVNKCKKVIDFVEFISQMFKNRFSESSETASRSHTPSHP